MSILLATALAAAFYLERRRYMQKTLRHLREQGLRAEAVRPGSRNRYRFRATLVLFAIGLASYPLVQWILPDARLGVRTLVDALVLGSFFLLGAVFCGRWFGDMWFDTADAAYREAKAREDTRIKT